MTAFLSSERGEHEHVRGRGVWTPGVAADQVPAVGRAECPRELELAEAEQRGDRRRLTGDSGPRPWGRGGSGAAAYWCTACRRTARWRAAYLPAVLIAYLLGAIGTIGSLIWLMWLISCVHCCGWRMLATWAESFVFWPYSGVYAIWIRFA